MKIITNSELYFASPKAFKDPFDCKVYFRPSVSKNELRKKHKEIVKKFMPQSNRTQRRAKVAQDVKAATPNEFLSKISSGLQKSVNNLGILSLSSNPLNILLWSHYACGHTGMCLKFLTTGTTPFFGLSQKVNYETKYPIVDLLKDGPGRHTDAFLLTKAIDWKYEDEWRIIDHTLGAGYRHFPEKLLMGIIFGARMPI